MQTMPLNSQPKKSRSTAHSARPASGELARRAKSTTGENIGPGSYESEDRSIAVLMKKKPTGTEPSSADAEETEASNEQVVLAPGRPRAAEA